MSTGNTTARSHLTPTPASTSLDLSSALNRLSASLSSILFLLEVQSDHSEEIHGTHCLLVMVKSQLDQLSAEVCLVD
ncbi:DUF1484 family protein [Cupriavidus sp. WKF15]|uniref:DUF1484 family protein n=1 Tax=Cupriavidus sp. WKF15 TaxID=3032282 RepID=UPI0023E27435|nr:DUF1484 family protein [Cupriavidus sp. WKF15]WER49657.1 DUF1484 family protein [Cupriavidus sp. WKF15]